MLVLHSVDVHVGAGADPSLKVVSTLVTHLVIKLIVGCH